MQKRCKSLTAANALLFEGENLKKQSKSAICIGIVIAANLAFVLLFGRIAQGISGGDLAVMLPQSKLVALVAILGLYALKSLSIIFPIIALQMTAGLVYGPVGGLFVNMAGMAIGITVSYLLGRFIGTGLQQMLCEKFKSVRKIEQYRCENETMFSYILRAVSIFPADIVSLYLGSTGIRFGPYFGGSMLGTFTGIVIATLFGDTLRQGFSMQVVVLWLVLLAISYAVTGVINRRIRSRM